jgi:signal peptidase II
VFLPQWGLGETVPSAPPPVPTTAAERTGDGAPPTLVGSATEPSRPARWIPFFALVIVVATADQIVKAWIVANYQVGEAVPTVGDLLRIAPSHNTGALFGLFRDQAPIFALLSLAVIGLILWYESRAGGSLLVTIALGLLLGGAIGNLSDRLRLGYVVDFVDMGIGTWRWYTFNVADASISTAVLLLLLMAVRPGIAGSERNG